MIEVLAVGVAMVLVTTAIHAAFMLGALTFLPGHRKHAERTVGRRVMAATSTILWMVCAAVVEMAVWAWLLIRLGALDAMEPALYFSSVTYTTLGYGDITLNQPYRLLGAVEALAGIIMSGWSTALVIAVLQRTEPTSASVASKDSHD